MSNSQWINVCCTGGGAVVSVAPDGLNRLESARQVAREFGEIFERGLCRSHPIDQIYVDLSNFDRITSEGLNGLIQMNCKTRHHGVRMILKNVPQSVRSVFKLTRMERMFEFSSDSEKLMALG